MQRSDRGLLACSAWRRLKAELIVGCSFLMSALEGQLRSLLSMTNDRT